MTLLEITLAEKMHLSISQDFTTLLSSAPCSITDTSGLASAVTLLEILMAELQMEMIHGPGYKSNAITSLHCLTRPPSSKVKARTSCVEAAASVSSSLTGLCVFAPLHDDLKSSMVHLSDEIAATCLGHFGWLLYQLSRPGVVFGSMS